MSFLMRLPCFGLLLHKEPQSFLSLWFPVSCFMGIINFLLLHNLLHYRSFFGFDADEIDAVG